MVDRVHIQQVLINLIRNAFEALGETGSVVVSAQRDGAMLRMSVVDNGPGIAPAQQEAVFEPFVSSKATGMGLGLAICRTIVEAHGGRLWCEAAPGGGSAFYFTLPTAEDADG
jgi:two-component system sensor kinase FixL